MREGEKCMTVTEECFVRLRDLNCDEIVTYQMVKTKRKMHYVEGKFNYNRDTGGVTHSYSAVEELEFGGNGIDTLSNESDLGKQIFQKSIGEIVSYTNKNGGNERFKIVGISIDGTKWEE